MFAFQRFVKMFEACPRWSRPIARMILPMKTRSLVIRTALAFLIPLAPPAAFAEWQPTEEPAVWQARRIRSLPGDGWIFMESLDSPALKAAEYIRGPQPVSGGVELEAGLLLQRGGQGEWINRVFPMRANCSSGQLEQRNSDGVWTNYPGRDGTVVKVRWICSLR